MPLEILDPIRQQRTGSKVKDRAPTMDIVFFQKPPFSWWQQVNGLSLSKIELGIQKTDLGLDS